MSNTFYVVYADDPDAHVIYPVTDANGAALDFTAVVAVGTTEVTAAWVGSTTTTNGATTRDLDVPLADVPTGNHRLRLKVPGDNDLHLGSVLVR